VPSSYSRASTRGVVNEEHGAQLVIGMCRVRFVCLFFAVCLVRNSTSAHRRVQIGRGPGANAQGRRGIILTTFVTIHRRREQLGQRQSEQQHRMRAIFKQLEECGHRRRGGFS
jgi:hypothetical protein